MAGYNRGILVAVAALAAAAGMFPYAGRSVIDLRYQGSVGRDAAPKKKSQKAKRVRAKRTNGGKKKQNFHKRQSWNRTDIK
jgi:hypothetical protein